MGTHGCYFYLKLLPKRGNFDGDKGLSRSWTPLEGGGVEDSTRGDLTGVKLWGKKEAVLVKTKERPNAVMGGLKKDTRGGGREREFGVKRRDRTTARTSGDDVGTKDGASRMKTGAKPLKKGGKKAIFIKMKGWAVARRFQDGGGGGGAGPSSGIWGEKRAVWVKRKGGATGWRPRGEGGTKVDPRRPFHRTRRRGPFHKLVKKGGFGSKTVDFG